APGQRGTFRIVPGRLRKGLAPAAVQRNPGTKNAPRRARSWSVGGSSGSAQQEIGDDAGGDGHQQEVAVVVPHPAVTPRRVAQAIAVVVVHHVDRPLVMVHVAAPGPARRTDVARGRVVVANHRAVMDHHRARVAVIAVVAAVPTLVAVITAVVTARMTVVATVVAVVPAAVVPATVVVAVAMAATAVVVGQRDGRRGRRRKRQHQGGAPLESEIHVFLQVAVRAVRTPGGVGRLSIVAAAPALPEGAFAPPAITPV